MLFSFGSINVDMIFQTPHLPNAGETLLTSAYDIMPGGKGANQAYAAAKWNGPVAMVGCVGDDALAETALSLLRPNINLEAVQRVQAPTGCASIYVDAQGENMIVVASGANGHLLATHVPEKFYAPGGGVLAQLETPFMETCQVFARAKATQMKTFLSLAPFRPLPIDDFQPVDYVFMNAGEAEALAKSYALSNITALLQHLWTAAHTCGIITQGAAGVLSFDGETVHHVPALKLTPVDTVGAGDTLAGVFAASLLEGYTFEQALHHGALAGSLACMAPGAQPSMPTRMAVINYA